MRAPEIYYSILERGTGKFIKLGTIADVEYGIKTGANDFFYLDDEEFDKWKIEEEYLIPVFKSPKDSRTIKIKKSSLSLRLFYCHKSKKELKGTNALKYIEWGEKTRTNENGDEIGKFHERPSCRGRVNWYDVGIRKKAVGIFPKGFGDIFRIFENQQVVADCRLYEIYSKDADLVLRMNSTLFFLFLEISARKGLGDGLMEFFVFELPNFLIPHVDVSKFKQRKQFVERDINDIISELGFDKMNSIREQSPNPLPDRKALDDIIFDGIGLSQEERNEVYWSVAELVKQRLDKAASR